MKYQIYVRKVEEKDLSRDCPYPDYDDETYAQNLLKLVAEINLNHKVTEATENNNIITIESELKQKDLLNNLESIFKMESCFIKTVKIKEIV
ncbi:MAG: hypothetical protein KAQ94_07855 [Arcobacteraceae bacterium]|nr:hypothetical protein [Arcobacteraceae bacterium]